jgi:hypothetical protein
MREGIGQGFGALAAIGCAAAVMCCSASDGGGTEARADDATETRPATPPPPPAPTSPIPDDLQLDAAPDGRPAADPVDPGFRTIWAIDSTNRLVRFTSADPGAVTTRQVTGLTTNEKIVAVDFRPADGKLYALGTSSRLYTLDRASGAATPIGTKPFTPGLSGTSFGFDFNPVADKARAHSDTDQNLRLDAVMGTATLDGTLAFAPGDVNFGQSPNLVATAYTNSVRPAPATTTLYAIDSTRNLLTKLASPNDGKISTVGPLGVDVTEVAGFDIWGGEGKMQAYAALVVSGKTGLYAIDLAKGTATPAGEIEHATALSGFAIEP